MRSIGRHIDRKRYLRPAIAFFVSIIIILATIAIWLRNNRYVDTWSIGASTSRWFIASYHGATIVGCISCASSHGASQLVGLEDGFVTEETWTEDFESPWPVPEDLSSICRVPRRISSFGGVAIAEGDWDLESHPNYECPYLAVLIPLWVWWIPTTLIIIYILWKWLARDRRRTGRLCRVCSYDRRSSLAKCPECGDTSILA